jgi:serine/threonine protein kinase
MENIIIGKKYLVINKIGNGSFGSIFKGENIRTKELVAIKVESINQNLKLLKNESNIYQYLKELEGIPNIKWYGKDEINYYMVIPLLGDSLQLVIDSKNNNSTNSLLFIKETSIQILFLIKSIHEKGLIHRDIKPDNFLFGKNNNKLFLIDFGLCKFFLDNNNNHISIKKTSYLIGSINYVSINSHEKFELSRRDDIISLGYIMFYLYYERLDWSDINGSDKTEENLKKIYILKKNILKKEKIPFFLFKIIEYGYSLTFEEEPNYFYLNQLINQIV